MSAVEARPAHLWDIAGQEAAVTVLRKAAVSGEVGHAWAFVGPPGVGQAAAARALTATLVCQAPDAPCGTCDVCRRCARGVHPALIELRPTGAAHRVADVREHWLPVAFRSAGEGGWKVLRIVEADRLNEAAANAFLKALEEPPPRTLWVLEVGDPDDLPDTVLSRCRPVRFTMPPAATLDAEAQRLGIADPADRALAVRASLGFPARLSALAADGGVADLRWHRSIPGRLAAAQGSALVAAHGLEEEVARRTAALRADAKAERESVGEEHGGEPPRAIVRALEESQARREREARTAALRHALDDIASWYRDVLLVAAGAGDDQLLDPADGGGLRAAASVLGPAAAMEALDAVLTTRDALEFNVQPRLALEALLMDLTAVELRAGAA